MGNVHKMWLSRNNGTPLLQSYHPMIECLRTFISQIQKDTGERVFQASRIPLPFQVESLFEVYPQIWPNGLQMLCVMLRAPVRYVFRASCSTKINFVRLEDELRTSQDKGPGSISDVTNST